MGKAMSGRIRCAGVWMAATLAAAAARGEPAQMLFLGPAVVPAACSGDTASLRVPLLLLQLLMIRLQLQLVETLLLEIQVTEQLELELALGTHGRGIGRGRNPTGDR